MPIKDYGVFAAYPVSYTAEKDNSTPHLQLYYDPDPNAKPGRYRAAINIKSSTAEARLVYWFVRNLNNHPITSDLASLQPGWHALSSDGLPALDYIRGNLMDLRDGTLLRHNVPGENNDIIDFMGPVLDEAISRGAMVYLFGQEFPGGIHDVHMNQGNEGRFKKDNGVYQDGGIILHFPDDDHWEGIFLAFGVQKVHTDDTTGSPISNTDFVQFLTTTTHPKPDEPIPGKPIENTPTEGTVYIRAALLNPVGPDPDSPGERESVHLLNRTQNDINLSGWTIVNRNRNVQKLNGVLKGGAAGKYLVPDCPLSNQGGTISLLDARGLKVDGVSYSKAQAKREGVLVMFH